MERRRATQRLERRGRVANAYVHRLQRRIAQLESQQPTGGSKEDGDTILSAVPEDDTADNAGDDGDGDHGDQVADADANADADADGDGDRTGIGNTLAAQARIHSGAIAANTPPVTPDSETARAHDWPGSPPPDSATAGSMTSMSNPLASEISAYMQDTAGRLRYLGHTSNWSFNHRVLSLAHAQLNRHSAPLDEASVHAEGEAFDLGWNGLRDNDHDHDGDAVRCQTAPAIDVRGLPSLDFSLYLVNTVKFRICQLLHLFDEETFFSHFYDFYEQPQRVASRCRLWFIHYLLVTALGKALLGRNGGSERLPGCDLFVRAITLLPDATYLCVDQVQSSEILTCIALYLQSLDFRAAAHVYIGQAVRVAMSHGLHTHMQIQDMGEKLVFRCRRIWWTIYILNRKMSSLMGAPNSVHDEDITAPLPVFPDNKTNTAIFKVHVELSQVLGIISSTVYGADGRLDKTFVATTQRVLRGLAGMAENIASVGHRSVGEINRTAGHLNLTYHQAIVLATRPVLYSLLKLRLESPNPLAASAATLSEPASGFLRICVDSARQIIHILSTLQEQSLLDSFLPFDLDSVTSSGFVLAIASAIDAAVLPDQRQWLQGVTQVLKEMSRNGNALAQIRLEEVQHLVERLAILVGSDHAARRAPAGEEGGPGRGDGQQPHQQHQPHQQQSQYHPRHPNQQYQQHQLTGLSILASAVPVASDAPGHVPWETDPAAHYHQQHNHPQHQPAGGLAWPEPGFFDEAGLLSLADALNAEDFPELCDQDVLQDILLPDARHT
ncbi:hypothetical protein SEUCBS139899_010526 [Sporothrix eucalyptigena]